jgi:GATA zinc finger
MKTCQNTKCNASNTPVWRKGWKLPSGNCATLCNACGLHYIKGHYCKYCFEIYKDSGEPRFSAAWISCKYCELLLVVIFLIPMFTLIGHTCCHLACLQAAGEPTNTCLNCKLETTSRFQEGKIVKPRWHQIVFVNVLPSKRNRYTTFQARQKNLNPPTKVAVIPSIKQRHFQVFQNY